MTQTFDSLARRMAYGYAATFPEFMAVESAEASQESQRQMHRFLQSVVNKLYEDPAVLRLPELPDGSYGDGEMQNSRPELVEAMRRILKKIDEFYLLLIRLGENGQAREGRLAVPKSAMKLQPRTLATLEAFGLRHEDRKEELLLWSDAHPDVAPAWKLLAASALASGKDPALIFSRCLFDPAALSSSGVFLSLVQHRDAYLALEDFFIQNGYTRMDNRENAVSVDWYKTYSKKDEPLKVHWAERVHGGLSVYFDGKRQSPVIFGLRVPRFKELLARFDDMDDGLKEFTIARTKKCDDCGYCTQTDKTGALPRQIVSVSHGSQYDLCTLFPGFSYVWTSVDGRTAEGIMKFLSFVDESFKSTTPQHPS